MARRRRVDLICTVCGGQYWMHAYRAESSKYCSKACWARRAPRKPCECCGGEFAVTVGGNTRYCSRRCAHVHMVGPRAASWKDGKSLERERGRMGPSLVRWRNDVFKRDDYRCVRCHTRGCPLHAHHIKYFADYPALRLELSNGETLCVPCHSAEHGRNVGRMATAPAEPIRET